MSQEGYEITGIVAHSPRSIIRRARRSRDGEPVIIKSLGDDPSPHEIAQLELEYRILRKLDTPGTLRALDLVRDGNDVAMVVADFGGQPLPSCADGTASLDLFFSIAISVTKTIGQVHAQSVLHNDIKPHNISMNRATREVKIIDFSSAIELPHDYRSDYHALGATFFELLAGDQNPAVPEALARIIRKLRERNPDDGYQSAHDILTDLDRCHHEWAERREHDVSARRHLEEKLATKNREVAAMLDNIHHGVFTIGPDLLIHPEYSAHLEQILGTKEIAGADCVKMIFEGSNVGAHALDAMRGALQRSFGVSRTIAEADAPHLVRALYRKNARGEIRYFEIDWDLIVGGGNAVYKVLVVLRDVTLVRQLKDSVAASAREIDMLGHILDAGIDPFQRFCAETRARLGEITAILESEAPLGRASLERMFRAMHTIKGNARLLGLAGLVDIVHIAEEAYVVVSAPSRAEIEAGIEAVLRAIESYEDAFRRKLGDVQRGHGARVDRMVGEIQSAIADAASGALTHAAALRLVERALRAAEAVPLADVVKESARMLPSLASELDKVAPRVDCDDCVLLAPAWAAVLKDAFVHAFRNAIHHGLEAREERERRGKPAQGCIGLRVDRVSGGAVIRLSDDGRGLAIAALRERSQGVAITDEEVASTIFVCGVSTAATVTATSGRGVGMDAIRSFVRRHGGEVRVVFTAEGADGYRAFELVIELPEGALVVVARDSKAPPRLAVVA